MKLTITAVADTTSEDAANSYRVDVSDDGAVWETVHLATLPINENEYEHEGADVKAGKGYYFRFFAKLGSDYGLASGVVRDWAGHSEAPGKVQGLGAVRASASASAGSIVLSWRAPMDDGGAAIEKYCIVANEIEDDDTRIGTDTRGSIIVKTTDTATTANCTRFGATSPLPISLSDMHDGIFDVAAGTTSVTFKGIMQESRWEFQVYALNGATGPTNEMGMSTIVVPANGLPSEDGTYPPNLASKSDDVDAKTSEAAKPAAPPYLTAENAKDTNLQGVGKQGVLVLWTTPADPPGAPVLSYKVERSVDGGEFETREIVPAAKTRYEDKDERPTDQSNVYRVTSINEGR